MGLSNQDATTVFTDNGLRTQYGVILPPGSRVAAYVRSTGIQSGDDSFLSANLVGTLAAGLARARAGLGDFVVCLPGHVESVTDGTTFSAALLTGTKIIGCGTGGNTPTFTWTATAGQWNIGVADVVISGLRLNFAGINAVVNAINVNAADCTILFNEFIMGAAGAALGVGITCTANANRANISSNTFRGLNTALATNGILVSGACNDVRICDNEMCFGANSGNGNINVTAAALGMKIYRNVVENSGAATLVAINFGNVASEGYCVDNRFYCKNPGAMVSGTNVIGIGASSIMAFANNFCSNDPRTSGIVLPTLDT